jgi:hypothetical protein
LDSLGRCGKADAGQASGLINRACKYKALRNGRCRLYDGASTNPKTPEARAGTAEAQCGRWLVRGDGNDVVLTEHIIPSFTLHHVSAMTAGDWLFAEDGRTRVPIK